MASRRGAIFCFRDLFCCVTDCMWQLQVNARLLPELRAKPQHMAHTIHDQEACSH